MAVKVTKLWANQTAAGTSDQFKALNRDIDEVNKTLDEADRVDRLSGLADLYREGQTLVEVLVSLGISRDQYNRACGLSKKFKLAHDAGLIMSEAWWMTLGRTGAAGRVKIQPASWIWVTKNRFNWREPKDGKGAPPDPLANTTIKPEMTPEDAAKIYQAEILNKK